MPILRPMRQRRRNALIRAGFLPFEAYELSKIEKPLETPYIAEMIKERASAYEEAIKAKLSAKDWRETIREMYRDKGWLKDTELLFRVPDPWQMLRAWEDRYKDRMPDYTSPWQKKSRKRSDFISKYEMGIDKYPRGRHYR